MAVACRVKIALIVAAKTEQRPHTDRIKRAAAYQARTSAVRITFCRRVDQISMVAAANIRDSAAVRIIQRQRVDRTTRVAAVSTRLMAAVRTDSHLQAGPILMDARVILTSLDVAQMVSPSPKAPTVKVIAQSMYDYTLIKLNLE